VFGNGGVTSMDSLKIFLVFMLPACLEKLSALLFFRLFYLTSNVGVCMALLIGPRYLCHLLS